MAEQKPSRRPARPKQAAPADRHGAMRVEREESSYRGHRIEVVREFTRRPGKGAAEECCQRLFIDGQEIDVTETPSGVESSQNIFREYGSIHELAEAVVRQWGRAPVRPVVRGEHDHGGHDHGGHDHGGHDHGGGGHPHSHG